MKRLFNLLLHCVLLIFIPLGFDGWLHGIFTVTFFISIFIFIYDPIAEFRNKSVIRKIKHKSKVEVTKTNCERDEAEALAKLHLAKHGIIMNGEEIIDSSAIAMDSPKLISNDENLEIKLANWSATHDALEDEKCHLD